MAEQILDLPTASEQIVVWDLTPASTATPRNDNLYYVSKRAFDLVATILLLIVLSPLLLLIAILIALDSPGPVIFKQKRMGYDWRTRQEKPFIMWKFRSMYANADERLHQVHIHEWVHNGTEVNGSNGLDDSVKLTNDPRVTKIGAFLRKTSLDELPQLYNILVGEMSLVGPRPVPLYEVAEYSAWHRQRLQAIPGLTGLWQVETRGRGTVDEMAWLDIRYINEHTFWLDLKILLVTVPAMLTGRGAG